MITIVDGDLLKQDVEVIVNPWNRNMIPHFLLVQHGVSGAIKKKAGWKPFNELGFRHLGVGKYRITSAGKLPYKAIIHVPGIDWNWEATENTIKYGARAAIEATIYGKWKSVAIPIIGSGVGKYHINQAIELIKFGIAIAMPKEDLDIRIVRFKPQI